LCKTIDIYPFNFENKDDIKDIKIQFIFSLYHELRHMYQAFYKTKKFIKECFSDIPYDNQWAEKDANLFSLKQCIKHNKSINEILNIDYNFINYGIINNIKC